MRTIKNLLAAALLVLPLGLKASTASGQVSSFGINAGLIFELYNVAQQSNGQVTSWPASMNAAVVQATVKNIGGTSGKLCFQVVVKEPGSVCANSAVVYSPTLTTRMELAPGESRTLTAADFELDSGAPSGSFCTDFEAQIKKDFEDIQPDSIQKAVDMFLKRRFQICLVPVYCGSNSASGGAESCTTFTLFQGNPGAQAQVGMLIYPHNNAVPDCGVNFLWTPALYPGLTANDVYYTLEVREDVEGPAFASVDVPAGQTYYQWSGRDRVLTPGQKYYWRLVSKKVRGGQPFGGPDGRGWNIQKWFVCGAEQAESKCRYSLEDLEQFVKKNASPDVREALKGFLIKAINTGQLDDPAVCRLLSGKARVSAITVTKK